MDQTQLSIPDFNEKFRGYDIDEVNAYLAQVSGQLAELARERDEAVARAASLQAELHRAQEAVATAAATPPPAPASSLDTATGEAARMLSLASQTAERAVADAQSEASRIVGDANAAADQTQREARVEADRIVGEARVNAEQMLTQATEQAAQEYGARRDEILAEIGSLESNRSTAVTQLAAVEARIEEYRGVLRSISSTIDDVLSDPDKMLRPPLPGIEVPTPAQFIDVDSRPAESFAAVEQAPTTIVETIEAEVASGRPAFADEPFEAAAPAYVDTVDAETAVDPASFVVEPVETELASSYGTAEAQPTAGQELGAGGAYDASAFDSPTADAVAYGSGAAGDSNESAFNNAAFSDPYEADAQAGAGETYSGFGDDGVAPAWDAAPAPEAPAGDSWAPGSWSEVAGLATTDEAFSAAPQPDYGTDAFAEPDGDPVNSATFPTGGLPPIGADRYTRELDEVLNTEADDDEAMARFFEGDDERQTRRFGRRR